MVESCNAKIATTSKTNFYIEFFSSCSEGLKRTGANNDWRHVSGESDPWPIWKSREPLALIRPIITEENYLEQQHLLVMFKSQEGDEPYGVWGGGWGGGGWGGGCSTCLCVGLLAEVDELLGGRGGEVEMGMWKSGHALGCVSVVTVIDVGSFCLHVCAYESM